MKLTRFEKSLQGALRTGKFEIVHQTASEKKAVMNAARESRKRREAEVVKRRRRAA